MVERSVFDRLVTRLGPKAKSEAIEAYHQVGFTPTSVVAKRLSKAAVQAYHLLFDTNLRTEILWERYRGVSEPATVPRQTPQARVTPGADGTGRVSS